MENGLIDQYILTFNPVLLGNGIRLFPESGRRFSLELLSSREDNGLLECRYRRSRA